MAYRENTARRYETTAPEVQGRVAASPRREFGVLTGGGLDAQARAAVKPGFVAILKYIAMVTLAIVIIGAVQVSISVATVQALTANNAIKTQLSSAEDTQDQLKVTHSILAAESRIGRIATQNYGMNYASEHITMDLSDGQTASSNAVENAQSAANAQN